MKKGDCSSPVKALVQIDVNKHAIYENVCYAFFLKEIRISYSIYPFSSQDVLISVCISALVDKTIESKKL